MDFVDLASMCAPEVHSDTMRRIVQVESSFNPYAIGIVGARLERQPRSLDEAVRTAATLEAGGYNYSIGLAQINRQHFGRFGLTPETGFDVCANLRTSSQILRECFERAGQTRDEQGALQAAFSCYYSGNFSTGFAEGYVGRILAVTDAAAPIPSQTPVVPQLKARADQRAPLRVIPVAPRSKPATPERAATKTPAPRLRAASPEPDNAPTSALLF
ncbi:MAG: lytic transglycosylase domain-containing protein [Lautropia sp.]